MRGAPVKPRLSSPPHRAMRCFAIGSVFFAIQWVPQFESTPRHGTPKQNYTLVLLVVINILSV